MQNETLSSPPSAVLQASQVGKKFGRTVALQDVSLEVLRGEVHALLGHNGSGKSTMVKIISGVLAPDNGAVTVTGLNGRPAQTGVVHQDLGLCFDATVLENCCMVGYQSSSFARIDWAAERRIVEPILQSLDAGFSSSAMLRDLSPANQAIVAIARALKRAATSGVLDLLVLDEATARLRGRDADKVLATARLVAKQGGGVLIVTHHMSEVLRAADRATVLMNGKVAGIVNVADTTEEALLELASGRRVSGARGSLPASLNAGRSAGQPSNGVGNHHASGITTPTAGHTASQNLTLPAGDQTSNPAFFAPVVLTASHIEGERFRCEQEIRLGAGEIVGLTGAPGAGHEELPYLLTGATQRGSARVSLAGKPVALRGVHESRRRGIGLVPAERLAQGVLLQASVRENLSPVVRSIHTWMRLLSKRRELAWATQVCGTFQIKASEPDAAISTLSGGNQQKVLLARVLKDRPKVLLLHEPTEGVDEMTRRDLVELIRKVAAQGTAVLYVSSDIDEVAGCSDRVLVVREGELAGEFAGGPGTVDSIYAACYLTSDAAQSASHC